MVWYVLMVVLLCSHAHGYFSQIFARKEFNFERMSERDRKQIAAKVCVLTDSCNFITDWTDSNKRVKTFSRTFIATTL
jgi:hypothetical protein